MFNLMPFPCDYITHADFSIPTSCTTLTFVISAPTCFGRTFWPSSGSYKTFQSVQRIWQHTHTHTHIYIYIYIYIYIAYPMLRFVCLRQEVSRLPEIVWMWLLKQSSPPSNSSLYCSVFWRSEVRKCFLRLNTLIFFIVTLSLWTDSGFMP
jgi:hypothetical protein